MRNLKLSAILVAAMLTAGFTLLNGQVGQVIVEQDISEWVECANGGAGEFVEGTIMVQVLFWDNGSFMGHPYGEQLLYGQTSGEVFHATGVTLERLSPDPNGSASVDHWTNRYHFIGKYGTQFYVKENAQFVENANGIVLETYTFDIICK